MGSFSIWHWLVAFVILAVIAAVVTVAVILVVNAARKPSVRLPPPGWFPDPQDPNQFRWFDGRSWTDGTKPR